MLAHFVGRVAELAFLRNELEESRLGHPRVVLVEGSAGIGKTAVVQRFLAEQPDVQVLRAIGDESDQLLAYGVVDQLVRSATVAGATVESRRAPLEDHLTVGGQVLNLLGSVQGQGPAVVVIDDAHWADEPSLKALLFALRRLLADQVLTLLVVRGEEVKLLPEGMSRLIRDVGATLYMKGLTAEDLGALAELIGVRPFSAEAGQRLHQLTEGNPLHAQSLLSELPVTAWANTELPLPAPRSFRALVLRRRSQCSEDAQRLVDAASVLGIHCALGSAARLAGIGAPLEALDEASAVGLLRSTEPIDSRTITFPHPLVHAAVYHALGPATRSRLHAGAAGLAGDEASSLRHRVAAAPGADPALAAELAAFADAEAGRGAWASAAAHLISASRLSPERPERELLLLKAVDCMLFGGNLVEAGAYTEDIARLAPSARRDSVLGQLALQRGQPAETGALLQSAWRRRDPSEPEVAAGMALQMAVYMLAQIRPREGAEWARRALDLSAAPGNPITSRALGLLSLTLAYGGEPAEAAAVLSSMNMKGEAGPDDWALIIRGLLATVEDDLANAIADLKLAATTALQRGSLQTAASALGCLSTAEYYSGAWDDALRHAERAVLVNTESERHHRAFVASAAVAVPAARGDWTLADEHALGQASQFTGYESSIATAAMGAAQLAGARCDHDGVLHALRPLLGFSDRQGVDEPGFWPWQDCWADALVSLGRVSEADTMLRPHESLAAARGRRSMMARLARVRGRIEAAEGRAQAAESAFANALEWIEQPGMPFERARIQMAYGSHLRRLGRRHDAARLLLAARASLVELRAEPFLQACEKELTAAGVSPRKRRDEYGKRLTPQETSVARLVSAGLTNREVAAELVLSTKTIEFHLSQIFTKLGVTSRRQIAKHPEVAGAIQEGRSQP